MYEGRMALEECVGVGDDVMERLEAVCRDARVVIKYDPVVQGGDIFYNPDFNLVIIGDFIKEENLEILKNLRLHKPIV